MKYCIPYYNNFRYFNKLNEVIFNYTPEIEQTTIEGFINLIKNKIHKTTRIIIDINKVKDKTNVIPILCKMQKEIKNFSIKTSANFYKELKEAGLPFFFSDFCKTEEEVFSYIKYGVTDVYIVSNLAFNLEEVSKYCHENNINVRVIPNMAQYSSNCKEAIPAMCKFFIRPEDTQEYEKYIDVFEFMAPLDRLSVLFEIYNNKIWKGNLNDLIIGLNEDIDNSGIVPYFGSTRIKCKHKCMIGKCSICFKMKDIAEQFNKMHIEFTREKERKWNKLNEFEINEKISHLTKRTDSTNDVEVSQE